MSNLKEFIPVYEPYLAGNEARYLQECINTGWISSKGKFVDLFEKSFAKYINSPFALSTANGTVAIHLALEAIGIKEADEIIVPDLTFAASVNSILYTKATPVLVDCDPDTLNIDLNKIEEKITSKTKAIMLVHLYGLPIVISEIHKIAEKHNLIIIEDAAEAFGSEYKNKKVGTFGRVACFSFFGNKTITTGEGGMITFKNEEDYKKAKILRDHGMNPEKIYWHDYIGYNYRMTNLQAAIGYAQMEKADEIVKKKIKNANIYKKFLQNIPGIKFVKDYKNVKNTFWLVTIIIDENKFGASRDQIKEYLRKNKIDSRPVFYPIHQMPPYKEFNIDNYPNSIYASENGLSLPSSCVLDKKSIARICNCLIDYHKRVKKL
jgi:perosamine synthetase